MTDQQLLERIILNPKVMVGKPVVRGTRLTVEYLLRKAGARKSGLPECSYSPVNPVYPQGGK